jgi:hypothetical protein
MDLLFHRNWRQARAGFKEVLSKRPSSFALAGLAASHIAEGRMQEAMECAWDAWRLSPLVHSLGAFFCWVLYLNGDFDQVLDLVAQIRSGGGDGALVTTVEALALIQASKVSTNLGRLATTAADFPQNHTLQGILGYVHGISGEKSEARSQYQRLARCSATNLKSNGYALAIICVGLGKMHEAIDWLESAYAEGSLWSLGLGADPMLRVFAGDPRFERLVGKIGAATQCRAESSFRGRAAHRILDGPLLAGNL